LKFANPIRCIIVEDNILDQFAIKAMVNAYPNLELKAIFDNPLQAIEAIELYKPDLVFLDVEMPLISGIDFYKKIRHCVPMAVFVTSYPEFAVDGFELAALDYIVKPIDKERFQKCMLRVEEYWTMKQKSNAYDASIEQDTLVIKQGYDKLKLALTDIIYLEALQDYTKFHTLNKSYITLGSLTSYLKTLGDHLFIQTHRSYAVAKNKITRIQKNELYCQHIAIPIGKTFKNNVSQLKL
jgi:DNA-binding LytR/AlgR family response regulator